MVCAHPGDRGVDGVSGCRRGPHRPHRLTAQNGHRVEVSFVSLHPRFPLGIALLVAAVGGSVVTLLNGTVRITQLRGVLRRHRREHSETTSMAPAEPGAHTSTPPTTDPGRCRPARPRARGLRTGSRPTAPSAAAPSRPGARMPSENVVRGKQPSNWLWSLDERGTSPPSPLRNLLPLPSSGHLLT
jgi:hypothetical protein